MSSFLKKLSIATLIIASYVSPVWSESQKNSRKKLEYDWSGVVTHVSDGDTLWVQPARGGEAVNIRLDAIDAPEICQIWGPEAKAALSARVLHQAVRVKAKRRDGFGRLVARLSLRDASPSADRTGPSGRTTSTAPAGPSVDVGEAMVAGGHAWAHQYKSFKNIYGAQQHQAQTARLGLFGDPRPLHPREFRKQHGPCEHKRGKTR